MRVGHGEFVDPSLQDVSNEPVAFVVSIGEFGHPRVVFMDGVL
jgi:hypothetical protein